MTLSTQPLPTLNNANGTEDPKIRSLLAELQGIVNGGVDASNLAGGAVTSPVFKPSIGLARQTSNVASPTSAYSDVPGATVTVAPTAAVTAYVLARFQANVRPLLNQSGKTIEYTGTIAVDGSDQAQTAMAGVTIGAGNTNVFDELTLNAVQMYSINLAAGSHTIKLRLKVNATSGLGIGSTNQDATLFYLLVSQ